MSITNAATAPLGIAAKSARRRVRAKDLLQPGSISLDEWLKTSPLVKEIEQWKKEHPEEAAEIEAQVLKEMGLA